MTSFDVIVIGSGPSGVHAADKCAELGKSVQILDVGYDDARTRGLIPPGDFLALRRSDPNQSHYFLGNHSNADDLANVRVGAQLTPPREFITHNVINLAPISSSSFSPMQSLALGGLGAGWGAGAYSYNDQELGKIGLPTVDMARYYDEVAAEIGIAAAADDDISSELARYCPVLPPLELDSNASSAFESYNRRRDAVQALGLIVGRAPAAILSAAIVRSNIKREANPYDDMDFYSDSSRSVYRPRYTLEALLMKPNVAYRNNALVKKFVCRADVVEVHYEDVESGQKHTAYGRRLILAAGAIGTSRIALQSLELFDRPVPILSNPYTYLPCVNVGMIGRPAANRRHSLAQLCGVFSDQRRAGEKVILSFFSYRSLLLYKLVKEMPMPPKLGLLCARLLLSSLTVVGVHHADQRTPRKTMLLRGGDDLATLEITYGLEDDEGRWVSESIGKIRKALRTMGCLALGAISPGNGSSIHYAGAFTITTDRADVLGTTASGQLHSAPSVYIADSANWRYLPAKGLTLTLMANARRVAAAVCQDIR